MMTKDDIMTAMPVINKSIPLSKEELKIRLIQIGKSQMDIIRELQRRGYVICQPEFCKFFVANTPKGEEVLEEARKILISWENEVR